MNALLSLHCAHGAKSDGVERGVPGSGTLANDTVVLLHLLVAGVFYSTGKGLG